LNSFKNVENALKNIIQIATTATKSLTQMAIFSYLNWKNPVYSYKIKKLAFYRRRRMLTTYATIFVSETF